MNRPQCPPFELDELTIAELRRALAQGAPELTVREALADLAERDEVGRHHEQLQARYLAYAEAREQRKRAAEQEAADDCDHEQQRSGRPWSSATARYEAKQDARIEARERFELDEPRLPFADWVEAGAPERYRAETPVARTEGLLRRFGSLAG